MKQKQQMGRALNVRPFSRADINCSLLLWGARTGFASTGGGAVKYCNARFSEMSPKVNFENTKTLKLKSSKVVKIRLLDNLHVEECFFPFPAIYTV